MLKIMRLYKRPDSPNYYVEIARGKSVSLKTSDKKKAQTIFDEMKREELRVKLHLLDPSERITIVTYKEKYLAQRQDLSDSTLRADELALRLLGEVVGQKKTLRIIDDAAINQFVKVCLGRKVKPRSINTYLRHIKAALREAKELRYIKTVPRIKFLKESSRLPKIFAKSDYDRFLLYIRNTDFQMWRIVQFALWSGCRRSEILGIRWQDVRGDECRIVGKGDKDRWIDILPRAADAMGTTQDIGKVFHPFHKDTVSHRFKKYIVDLGIEGNFHMIRHTAATAMLDNEIPLPVIQKILGHADMRTTQIYAEVSDDLRTREMHKLRL